MNRHAKLRRLNIWMNGIPVGYWETARQGEYLGYFDEWLTDEQSRTLSLSLPFLPDDFPMDMAAAVFNGMRQQIARLAK
jgi:serine/threonine-protein kinase HipA